MLTPTKYFNWLEAMVIEAALVNPEITGTDTKSIRKPRIVEVWFTLMRT